CLASRRPASTAVSSVGRRCSSAGSPRRSTLRTWLRSVAVMRRSRQGSPLWE
ncbi:CBN-MECR-1 protein, partial [Aphelenchoides avenae]